MLILELALDGDIRSITRHPSPRPRVRSEVAISPRQSSSVPPAMVGVTRQPEGPT